jgi:hypothetical protein
VWWTVCRYGVEAARAATTVGGFSPQENPKARPLSLVRHKIVGRLHR